MDAHWSENLKRPRHGWTWAFGVGLLSLVVAMLFSARASAAPFTGAIYTTGAGCGGVNVNIFDTKQDVYLDGGPNSASSGSGLPDGDYYVRVTDPSGATLLGTSVGVDDGTPIHVTDGSFDQCYQLWAILIKGSDSTTGYDDTPNSGGEYKVSVSPTEEFDPDKTDNFKVVAEPPCEETNTCPVDPFGEVSGSKYYDANTDGDRDPGELGIANWPINYDSSYVLTDGNGDFSLTLDPGTYTFTEQAGVAPWSQTGNLTDQSSTTGGATVALNNKSYTVVLPEDVAGSTAQGLNFGNVCIGGGGGGLTLGFWSNKNGEAAQFKPPNSVGAATLAFLSGLNLRSGNGNDFNPTSYSQFRTWLLSATATNMAYMLSAQLAAMELNVRNGNVNGNSLIYAPGATSANANGFATVNAVMAEANTDLAIHSNTVASGALRTYQEALKNALDKANNNLNFVQGSPARCPAPPVPPALP